MTNAVLREMPEATKRRRGSLLCKLLLSAEMVCSVIFASSAGIVKTGKNVVVTGTGNAMRVSESELQVAVSEGAAVTITPGSAPVVVHGDDSAITLNNGSSWRDKVVFWLDAAATDSFTFERVGDAPDGVQRTVEWGGVPCPAINRWYDRRGTNQTYYALNQRGLAYAADKTYVSVMPFLVTDANGLPFVCFGNYMEYGRRMTFHRTDCPVDDYNPSKESQYKAEIQFKFAAVVFGSQSGGGASIVYQILRGNYTPGSSTAPAYTDPIFSTDYPTWVDGVGVDASTTGFNRGWQNIGFGAKDGGTLSASGLCYGLTDSVSQKTYYGGGRYREIIFLSEVPTEGERRNLEQYLAEKWNTAALPATPPSAAAEVRLFGTGTASVSSGPVALGGEFSGTVTVAEGATLVMTAEKPAPTAPASIGDSATTALHYDPNVADSIKKYWQEPYENSVGCLYETREIGSMDNVLYGSSRTPTWTRESRGFGPENTWLSYDSTRTLGQVGCTLRLGNKETSDGQTYNFRTGFMVVDTSAGAGTPFLATTITGDGKYLYARSVGSPVFVMNSSTVENFVKNADVRLNGDSEDVNLYARYFNSRPEVMSVSFTDDFPLRCLGCYGNTEPTNMLIHGEAIFYARELTETERCDTEAYLMKKWLGLTPSGYGNPVSTTIDGAGAIVLANHVDHPGFASTFTGSVSAPNSILQFHFSKDGHGQTVVDNAINAPGAAITTPSSITVRLTSDSRISLDAGDYTLIDCTSWTGGETVVLDVSSPSPVSRRGLELTREGNRLVLRVTKVGFCLLVK